MRSPQILLLVPLLVFVVVGLFTAKASEEPTEESLAFMQKIQQNDADGVLRDFGDNTCHCAPEGGYQAYLQYESGYNPNIAFLLGTKFQVGKVTYEKQAYNGEKYVFPWDKPEDTLVFVPIEFDANARPYFLPLDMAYGYRLSEAELKSFEADPATDWMRGFTLRLRSSLSPGIVKQRDPRAERTTMERAAEEGLLPKEMTRYLHPKDAAPVKLADDKLEPASTYAADLPRLKSIVIGLKVVRRGALTRWAVKKVGIQNAVLISNGKEILLKEPVEQTQKK